MANLMMPHALSEIVRGGWGAVVLSGPPAEAFPLGTRIPGGPPLQVGMVWRVVVAMANDPRFASIRTDGLSPAPSFPGLPHAILGMASEQRCPGGCEYCPEGTDYVSLATARAALPNQAGIPVPRCVQEALAPNVDADAAAVAEDLWLDLVLATESAKIPRKAQLSGVVVGKTA
jgi:hypothetical protein